MIVTPSLVLVCLILLLLVLVSSNLASKGSTSFFGGLGGPGSGSLDFPSAIRDNPVKGLNTDSETGSLESLSC